MPGKTFLCTRPSLAGQLMSSGYKGTPAVNVYHPEMSAWSFDLTMSLAFEVANYYKAIGKQPPKAIREFLKAETPISAKAEDLID